MIRQRAAFSLVELSIVLVILGLLVGGILAGQSLIHASELRAVGAEYHRYATAAQAFRDKYMGLPGDIANATSFWGFKTGNGCTNNMGAATDTANGVCDGNGDGMLSDPTGTLRAGEVFQFWRQLARAGLIDGEYTGISYGTFHQAGVQIGGDVPASKLTGAGWSLSYRNIDTASLDASRYIMDYGNFLLIGAPGPNFTLDQYVLTPTDAWNIDTKLDDGRPASGKIIGRSYLGCGTAVSGGTTATNLDARYTVENSNIRCNLLFRQLF